MYSATTCTILNYYKRRDIGVFSSYAPNKYSSAVQSDVHVLLLGFDEDHCCLQRNDIAGVLYVLLILNSPIVEFRNN